MLLDKPSLGPCRMTLRPYQEEFIEGVREEFRKGKRSTLAILPTGCGKTVCFGMIARLTIEKGGRVLILAHRDTLIEQAVEKLDELGIEAGIEMADQRARALFEPDAVVATVQTMQRKRLASWAPDYFNLVITDEAHHAISPSYLNVYKHFAKARHLGVTATADRGDGECLSQVFESVAYEMSLWDAMTAEPPGPYLCRLKFVQCDLGIDLRDLNPKAEDFNDDELEKRIGPIVGDLANAIRKEAGERKTMIFTPRVKSAQGIATALSSMGLAAEWSDGNDPDRASKVARFRAGDLQYLSNCALFTEGFDVPEIAAIGLCRPTKSRALYSQMVGRGTRRARGKDDCILIDFSWLTAEHDLVKPVELFDTTHTDQETLAIATELLKSQKDLDLVAAVGRASDVQKERQILRIKAREKEMRYRRVSYDPLSVYDTLGLPNRGSPDKVIHKASPGQVKFLEGLGVKGGETMSRHRASTLIDFAKDRRAKDLATIKQVSWLIAKGVEPAVARGMSFKEASSNLDRLFNSQGVA